MSTHKLSDIGTRKEDGTGTIPSNCARLNLTYVRHEENYNIFFFFWKTEKRFFKDTFQMTSKYFGAAPKKCPLLDLCSPLRVNQPPKKETRSGYCGNIKQQPANGEKRSLFCLQYLRSAVRVRAHIRLFSLFCG